MKSTIYFSSEKIEVIGFTGSGNHVHIKSYISSPTEGAVINGRITDAELLVEHLALLRDSRPDMFIDVSLTVDGSAIPTRQVTAPKLSAKQYRQLARDEFSEVAENFDGMVVDYRVLSSGENGQNVFICAADRAQIETYISVCRHAGVKLHAVHVGVEAIMNYVESNPGIRSSTSVINVVDGVTMLSMIFDRGVNVFMSRTRLYSEGHEQNIPNILENLSGLVNFNKSEKFGDISCSYYLGLNEKDLAFMREINQHPEVELRTLDISGAEGTGILPASAQFTYLHTMLPSGSIDLIDGLRELEKHTKSQRPKKRWIYAFALLIAAIAIPAAILFSRVFSLNREIERLDDYVNDPSALSKIDELDELSVVTARLNGILSQLEEIREEDAEKAVFTNRLIDAVVKGSSVVTIEQFNYTGTEGVLKIAGNSPTQLEFAQYVENLKRSDLVQYVQYSGYSAAKEGFYSFTADIYLVEEAVK